MNKQFIRFFILICVFTFSAPFSRSIEQPFKGVSEQEIIDADAKHVFEAIQALRDNNVKVISVDKNGDILEETFTDLPIIGKAVCRYRENFIPYKSITYKMLQSDHLIAFEGAWTLTPIGNGKQTQVKLASYVLTDVTIPFVHQLTNFTTHRDVKKRLQRLKKACESN